MKTMVELISWFQMEYPSLVRDMKQSNHHRTYMDDIRLELKNNGTAQKDHRLLSSPTDLNPYHLESDVFTHTMMVCKQAENYPYLVQVAALLHDIGKPSTRKVNPKNGRVSFYNHDAVSAFMSLEITKKLGFCESERAHVFNLIALHTQIYKLSIEQLAKLYDVELVVHLVCLGNADHAGRFHTAGEAVIPAPLDIMQHMGKAKRETTKEVHILCGLPASGKSTFVMGQEDKGINLFKISRDSCLLKVAVETGAREKGDKYNDVWEKVNQKLVDKEVQLRFKESTDRSKVVVDMTHMSKKSRRRSLSHFGEEYKKICHVFLTDLETMYLRNSERTGKVIGQSVFDKMIRAFYPPTLEEFDEIEYHF